MIGVFDSGLGGLAALAELHRLLPNESTVFLADRENAPYGKKSESELIGLVTADIDRLYRAGAERILVGCCTACTVLDLIDERHRELCTPIIAPAVAEAAGLTRTGKIAVLCTEATKRSAAYERAAGKLCPEVQIITLAAGELVTLVERGLCDELAGAPEREAVFKICEGLSELSADTLILGCTHFSHLERTLGTLFKMRTVSAARAGARCFAESIMKNK